MERPSAPAATPVLSPMKDRSLHWLGVLCAVVAGAWLGAAEAPTKLVVIGLSPFAISLCMVAGVFVARWSFPTLLKGTTYIFRDLGRRRHLIVWALLAGGLWAVANTLTVIAIRDVGLSVAFPLWNANALVGLLWGCIFFGELKGAGLGTKLRVLLGALAILVAATLLGFSSMSHPTAAGSHAVRGILAALGACVLWGTMYVPYRKAYISGMNPLSFVTAFTVGELGTVATLAIALGGGVHELVVELHGAQHVLFWLFLGGFVWVVGDLFQQFAAKYLGIGRGIPLTNTNQLWGLAWAALVFHELHDATRLQMVLVIGGSLGMILGAILLGTAVASGREQSSRNDVILRECTRYNLDYSETLQAMSGIDTGLERNEIRGKRRWWDVLIMLVATGFFVCFALTAAPPAIPMSRLWIVILSAALLVALVLGVWRLRRETNFS
jgi:drug/metabolite transporter (DMT)-like permease